MEVIIGFIASLIKIGILSSIYGLMTFWVFKLIGNLRPNSWFDRVSAKKLRLWFISGLVFSCGLFFYLFTYWGFHGFGDGPRIPIGHGVIVDNTNWDEYGYIHVTETIDSMKIEMTKFKVVNDKLIGNLQSGFYDYKNSYFMYDLDKKELTEFKSLKDYEDFAQKNKLPLSNELKTFRQNYSDYWSGWRFWLLP
jgi:energy-coupling factor transporter transmembrane protein EcfT